MPDSDRSSIPRQFCCERSALLRKLNWALVRHAHAARRTILLWGENDVCGFKDAQSGAKECRQGCEAIWAEFQEHCAEHGC